MGLIGKGLKNLFTHGWKDTARKVVFHLIGNDFNAQFENLRGELSNLWQRYDSMKETFERRINELGQELSAVRQRYESMERTASYLSLRNSELGFDQLGGRVDLRLTRLEILQYYANLERYNALDDVQKDILRYLEDEELQSLPRKFPVFPRMDKRHPIFPPKPDESPKILMRQDGSLWVWEISGKRVYMSENYDASFSLARNLYREFFEDSPHKYLEPEKDGVDVPEGAVLADVGAAEGLFSMLFVERCKKVYLFENDQNWIERLQKTFAPYMDKVEIVRGTVGNGPNDVNLDSFFKDKEPPSFIKMDIEGYEVEALRGMDGIINSDSPLSMLICTYHRQSDWDDFYGLLHERFDITSSPGYYWHMPDPFPPFFRHGVMRARKRLNDKV